MNKEPKQKYYDYTPENYTPLRKGIDLQREIFKQAMTEKNYEVAVSALENIKAEIKNKAVAIGNGENIRRIHKILDWYRLLPFKYTEKTENGYELNFPAAIELKIIKNLNVAYELTINLLNKLRLI